MLKIFVFKFAIVVSLFTSLSLDVQAMMLEDSETLKSMIRSGIPASVIAMARKEQTPETITKLILAAAPVYPLQHILALYPHKAAKVEVKGGEDTADASPGENAFFDACKQKPKLYVEFFQALTRSHFLDGYSLLNPDQPRLAITDQLTPVYRPIMQVNRERKYVKHTQILSIFRSFRDGFENDVNLAHLKRLLDISFTAPGRSLKKSNPNLSRQIHQIRMDVPLLRGEIALTVDQDLSKAYEYFLKILRTVDGKTNALTTVHLAEIRLGTYMNTMNYGSLLLNENEGVKGLMDLPNDPIAILRLAEYYLGFSGNSVEESKGLEAIAKAAQYDQISHIAYRVWAEYHLGITNSAAYNMQRAKELLDLAFQKCDRIKAAERTIQIRLGEIALGIFDKEEDCEEDVPPANSLSEKNIPRAIDLFKIVGPEADLFLHRIYTGYYGPEFVDPEAAQLVWNRLVSGNSSYIQMKVAMQEYNKGNIAVAVKTFEKFNHFCMGAYALGCIKSNPLYPEFYNPTQAAEHFAYLFGFDFRDSRARLCKLIMPNAGISVLPGYEAKAIQYVLTSSRKSKKMFTAQDFLSRGIAIKSKTASIPPASLEHKEELEAAPIELEEEITEEAIAIAQEMEAIDEREPLRVLVDERLQDLYDSLGFAPKWRLLQEVVTAFGGVIDLSAQTMKLPHSAEIFTFHRPHSGNPPIKMQGYWLKLKHMLDHELAVRCQMQVDNTP
jgi:hypothetical protein